MLILGRTHCPSVAEQPVGLSRHKQNEDFGLCTANPISDNARPDFRQRTRFPTTQARFPTTHLISNNAPDFRQCKARFPTMQAPWACIQMHAPWPYIADPDLFACTDSQGIKPRNTFPDIVPESYKGTLKSRPPLNKNKNNPRTSIAKIRVGPKNTSADFSWRPPKQKKKKKKRKKKKKKRKNNSERAGLQQVVRRHPLRAVQHHLPGCQALDAAHQRPALAVAWGKSKMAADLWDLCFAFLLCVCVFVFFIFLNNDFHLFVPVVPSWQVNCRRFMLGCLSRFLFVLSVLLGCVLRCCVF